MNKWTEEISPHHSLLDLKLGELWRYKDLLLMFVKRDFVTFYKQTILGPLWFFIQPLITSIIFLIVFGRIANISTDGVPHLVFYLSGVTLLNYFSDCFNKTANVFKDNVNIFGKVYYPRLIMPLSIVLSNLIKFSIQFFLFLLVWAWYYFKDYNLQPNMALLLIPYLLFLMAILALGLGMIFSSLTTKYKDLVFLLSFGIQLLMYATPIIYPLSIIKNNSPWLLRLVQLNPLSSIVETFRYGFTGSGNCNWYMLAYSTIFAFIVLFVGAIVFNKVEKSFMDTV